MGQALKIIQFDTDEKGNATDSKNKTRFHSKKIISPQLKTLRIAAILTAILGVTSLVLEVQFYFQYRYEIYIARLIPTLFSFITLLFIQSETGRKYKVIITHTYLFVIISSVSYVISKIPTLYLYNSIALSLFILTLSLFLLWETKNQIILSLYFLLSLGISAYFANLLDFTEANTYVASFSFVSVLIVAGLANYLQAKANRNNFSSGNSVKDITSVDNSGITEFLNSSTIAFFQLTKEGEIKYSNPSFNQIVGIRNNSDVSEINFFDDFIKNNNVKNHIIKKIENKGRLENYRVNIIDRENKNIVLLMDCKLKEGNNDVYLEGSIRDFTKQFEKEKLLTKELEAIKKAKPNKQKIFDSVIGEPKKKNLISKMGHELRTPMNSVLGFLTLIENGLFESEEELKDFSRNAKLSAESLLNLMNDIVEISKIDDGTINIAEYEFNLREEIEKIVAAISSNAKLKNIKLSCDISENIPKTIISDPTKYSQILTNLISNSVETSDEGEIKVFVSEELDKKGNSKIVTIIQDNSSNLPIKRIKGILNEDVDSDDNDSKVSTSVLHLMICKELTNLLGGTITFESKEKGAKYVFKIPIENSKIKQETAVNIELENNSEIKLNIGGKPKLLLVEDNPISRKVEKKLLEEAGYNVDCVDNGLDAIEKIQNGKFDLVLMDIELKEMDGLEATKKIRDLSEEYSKIPIIAVTAHSSMKDREKCLLAGMNDYISKPINITFLKMTIDQWLNAARAN